jgi:hypothetical protein
MGVDFCALILSSGANNLAYKPIIGVVTATHPNPEKCHEAHHYRGYIVSRRDEDRRFASSATRPIRVTCTSFPTLPRERRSENSRHGPE